MESDKTYSEKEIVLFQTFGYETSAILSREVSDIYRSLVDSAFINNLHGPNVEALRRGFAAFVKCHPYRKTKEFDDLITIKE